MPAYLYALEQESALYKGEKADTVFIGGGTPSLMHEEAIMQMIESVGRNIDISGVKEFTIECNPCSLTKEKLREYRKAGINRISIGAQSFDGQMLRKIGRSHSTEQFENAFTWAREAGFDNSNIDLIFALPGQSLAQWEVTLQKACAFAPAHISCYSLTLAEDTPLGRAAQQGEIALPEEETERQMYYAARRVLEAHGYRQYEISNYAKQGRECLHNLNCWHCGEYIGLGCAAHSYWRGRRYANPTGLQEYMRAAVSGEKPFANAAPLSEKERMFERLMLELRLNSGLNRKTFTKDFGKDVTEVYGKVLQKQQAQGLLEILPEAVRLTEKGRDFVDGLLGEYM